MTTNTSTHPLRCQCGAVEGQVDIRGASNRVICYCNSCRCFAKFCGAADILDRNGGTEIIQVAASRVHFTRGMEQLAAIRLTESGMIRWYTNCCKTPIGNTLANSKFDFVGLIHSCLNQQALEPSFGHYVAHVNVAEALGEPKPTSRGAIKIFLKIFAMILPGRLAGRFKHIPFFSNAGTPIVTPKVLDTAELEQLRMRAPA